MITFFAHLRIDCPDRLKNLQTILNYYGNEFPDAKFIFVEDDKEHNKQLNPPNIKYPKGRTSIMFMENPGPWHKTRALNYAVRKATTDIVIQLDVDCIFSSSAIKKCVEQLQNDPELHYGFPYNGYVIDLNYPIHDNFILTCYDYNSLLDVLPSKKLPLSYSDENLLVRCTSGEHLGVGGMVVFKRKDYCENGGYNPNFVCWGGDDNEIDKRFIKLGLKSCRITDDEAICFHLPHKNAIRFENPYYKHNYEELDKVEKMNKEELISYISTWKCCD
jgi:hypothetical protein